MDSTKKNELLENSRDVLDMVCSVMLKRHPRLKRALRIFEKVPDIKEKLTIETNGSILWYNPEWIMKCYNRRELEKVEMKLMHMVLHGILGHFDKRRNFEDKECIDAAFNFEVHKVMEELGYDVNAENDVIDYEEFRQELRNKSFRQIYYYAKRDYGVLTGIWASMDYGNLDDHGLWGKTDEPESAEKEQDNASESTQAENEADQIDKQELAKALAKWKEVSQSFRNGTNANRLAILLGKRGGPKPDSDIVKEQIKVEEGASSDYSELLSSFLHEREAVLELEDTIDKNLYNYGFELYGDVAIVEPEECTEVKQLSNLIIAIDTSGSCSGEIMNRFVKETKGVLKGLSDQIRFEGIYLIQCDDKIQKEEFFADAEDFPTENYMSAIGFGGTSFEPVFERAESLAKENRHIEAMIYFTDGYGDFPKNEPDYPVVFIMPKKGCNKFIPQWIKVMEI